MFDRIFTPKHREQKNPWTGAPVWAIEVGAMLFTLLKNQETQMAAIDDLKSAVTDLKTQLDDNTATMDALIAKATAVPVTTPEGTSDADVTAVTQALRDLITANQAEVAKAKSAL